MHMAAQITRFGSSMGSQAKDRFSVQVGGSSVSGDQEFLTEGDGVIGSPLRQPDSARRPGPG